MGVWHQCPPLNGAFSFLLFFCSRSRPRHKIVPSQSRIPSVTSALRFLPNHGRLSCAQNSPGERWKSSFPTPDRDTSDVILPLSNAYQVNSDRAPASAPGGGDVDQTYSQKKYRASAIREILASLPKTLSAGDEAKRAQVEKISRTQTGRSRDSEGDASYLASIDRVKQLFRLGRFEPRLVIDTLLRMYPTNPKLYEIEDSCLDELMFKLGSCILGLKRLNSGPRQCDAAEGLSSDGANSTNAERRQRHEDVPFLNGDIWNCHLVGMGWNAMDIEIVKDQAIRQVRDILEPVLTRFCGDQCKALHYDARNLKYGFQKKHRLDLRTLSQPERWTSTLPTSP